MTETLIRDIHYIHIPKTAGTSIKKALGMKEVPETAGADIAAPTLDDGGAICTTHAAPKELRARGFYEHPFFDKALAFTVVRNPWDRMLSYWWFIKTISHIHDAQWVYDDFEEFCGVLFERRDGWGSGMSARERLAQQIEWVEPGTRVLHFETLDLDFQGLCVDLGVDALLPVENRFHEPFKYRERYTPTAQDLVARACRDDVEFLGYEF